MTDLRHDDDTTRAVAHLPGLDIEVTHSRSPDAERISIHLQATPSFEAFGRFLEGANPFAFWMRSAQLAAQFALLPWSAFNPWLDATRALLPPALRGETPPTVPE